MGLKSEDAYATELQTVLRIAHALRDVAGVSHQPIDPTFTKSPSPHTAIDSINLPSPHPLLPSLLEAGFSHEIATSLNEIYLLRAEELRQRIRDSIAVASHKLEELPTIALASPPDVWKRNLVLALVELYSRRLERWKEEVIQRIKQAPKKQTKAAPTSSRNFNQEYVPVLEYFFKENPFPTYADKVFLAKKSNMQYRQIHVWFQNRRNRTKKEGKTLRKKSICEGMMKPSDKLYERMKSHMASSDSEAFGSSTRISQMKVTRNSTLKDVFASTSPSHAFPSPYPPTCHYDPFPCKGGGPVHLSKPEWRRMSRGEPPSPFPINIDDLIERFSLLNVRDETRSGGYPKLHSYAATVAITVIPCRAPHPSLMVRGCSRPANITQHRPPVRTPAPCGKAFQSPCSTPKPATSMPLSVQPNMDEFLRKRKIAPLPQRRVQDAHRDTSTSESSVTSSSSPRLFTTDSKSRVHSFSSVSAPSDIASLQVLPYSLGSSHYLPIDGPIHLRNTGGMFTISSLSVS